jgi:hypothetical protein
LDESFARGQRTEQHYCQNALSIPRSLLAALLNKVWYNGAKNLQNPEYRLPSPWPGLANCLLIGYGKTLLLKPKSRELLSKSKKRKSPHKSMSWEPNPNKRTGNRVTLHLKCFKHRPIGCR